MVLRDTFLNNMSKSNMQADIVEFDRMREDDDDKRSLKWLTEGIDRLLARDRME